MFYYMFSTLHPYLSLLFSHFVFFLSPSFSYSSRYKTHSTIYNVWCSYVTDIKKTLHNQNKYSSITIFGTKYELFLLPYKITFFLAFGQAKIFFSYHILMNISFTYYFVTHKIAPELQTTFQRKNGTCFNKMSF